MNSIPVFFFFIDVVFWYTLRFKFPACWNLMRKSVESSLSFSKTYIRILKRWITASYCASISLSPLAMPNSIYCVLYTWVVLGWYICFRSSNSLETDLPSRYKNVHNDHMMTTHSSTQCACPLRTRIATWLVYQICEEEPQVTDKCFSVSLQD